MGDLVFTGIVGVDSKQHLMDASGKGYWDKVGKRWSDGGRDRLWRRCSDAIHAVWLERAAAGLRGATVLKTDLFDEAFGDGLAEWFAASGNRVIGCDIAFSTAKGADDRGGSVEIVVSDVRRLPFRDGRFDCVLSDSTLDHFASEREIAKALGELSRVMQPGGLLLITMDNPRHPLVWLRNLNPQIWRRLGVVPYSVGVTCGLGRLTTLLEAAGFEVAEARGLMHSPRILLVALCRWLEERYGVKEPSPRCLKWLLRFEKLANLPTGQWSGHFIAVTARRQSDRSAGA